MNAYSNVPISTSQTFRKFTYHSSRKDSVTDTTCSSRKHSSSAYGFPVQIDNISDLQYKLFQISNLAQNWDGYGADFINERTILNTNKLLEKLHSSIVSLLSTDNITPTTYGTIVLDWKINNCFISVEIGETKIGFFSEFGETQNPSIEGVAFNENNLPQELINSFKKLFKNI